MKILRFSLAFVALVALSACDNNPAEPRAEGAADQGGNGPSSNGLILGSGNRSGSDSTAINTDQPGDNGLVLGSGNRSDTPPTDENGVTFGSGS